jgi:signal peptidase II
MARSRNAGGLLPWLIWAAVVVLLDQASKRLIMALYALHEGTPVTGFFNLMRVHNEGAAFSFLASSGGWQRWLFTGIALAAIALIVWMLRAHPGQKLFAFALSSILGGAVGNVIDRVLYGHVVDFLDFYYQGWHFPAFNLADSAITLGACCLIFDEFRRVRKQR